MKAALPLLAASLTLASCVPSATAPAPSPAPVARPAPVPPPAPAQVPQAPAYSSWMDVPATPGVWRYQPVNRGSQAVFTGNGTAAQAALICNLDTRSIAVVRFGAGGGAQGMTIRSETATRSLPVSRSASNPAQAAASVAPNDPLLDAMALSQGRFAVEVDGAAPLYLPSHAEISRVIEDCRG